MSAILNATPTGAAAAMHVVRLLREVRDVPAVPGEHAERRDGQLPRGQPAVLDADPGMGYQSSLSNLKYDLGRSLSNLGVLT